MCELLTLLNKLFDIDYAAFLSIHPYSTRVTELCWCYQQHFRISYLTSIMQHFFPFTPNPHVLQSFAGVINFRALFRWHKMHFGISGRSWTPWKQHTCASCVLPGTGITRLPQTQHICSFWCILEGWNKARPWRQNWQMWTRLTPGITGSAKFRHLSS